MSWFVLALIGDWRWVTPNGITLVSFVAKVAPAGMIAFGDRTMVLVAAGILQVGQVLDSMDGNLARYRGTSSVSGGYLDRVLDGLGFLAVCSALSWYAFSNGAAPYYLLVGPVTAALYLFICYIYWTYAYCSERYGTSAGSAPVDAVAQAVTDVPLWRYILRAQLKILRFNQADYYFWVGLGLVLGRPREVLWLLFATTAYKALERFVSRLRRLRHIDSQRSGQ
jgi:phosphatidylglycerophosphate synthase